MGVAVVTGGSRGIGAATARRLAADGWDVAIGFRSDEAAAAAGVADVEALGRRAVAVRGEVSDPAAVTALFDAAADLGPIGVVVNNAGIVSPPGRVEDYDIDRIREVLEVNVLGAFVVAGEAVRQMEGSGGVIVNVSSRAAVLGAAGEYVDYAASKAAVDALTVGLAAEVAGRGIRVVGVRPGPDRHRDPRPRAAGAAGRHTAAGPARHHRGGRRRHRLARLRPGELRHRGDPRRRRRALAPVARPGR